MRLCYLQVGVCLCEARRVQVATVLILVRASYITAIYLEQGQGASICESLDRPSGCELWQALQRCTDLKSIPILCGKSTASPALDRPPCVGHSSDSFIPSYVGIPGLDLKCWLGCGLFHSIPRQLPLISVWDRLLNWPVVGSCRYH
jgi:hypothetical protein